MEIGKVVGLWRYPVKSMRGEALGHTEVGPLGVVGDRTFALRDRRDGRIISAKKSANLLGLRAGYPSGPSRPAVVELADGRRLSTDAPDISATLSTVLGRDVELCGPDDKREDRHVEWEADLTFDAPPFAFVDLAPLHVMTTASLRAISALRAESRFDVRRFRPNVLIDCGDASRFVEDELDGKVLAIGNDVRLRVFMQTIRCALTTRAQEDIQADPAVLRTIVEKHDGNLGAYASVENPGDVRLNDLVTVLE
jgi:uncharacterized protein YcbX